MQSSNYVSFQNGKQFGKGPYKVKLKHRVTTKSRNPQKLTKAIYSLFEHSGLASKIQHFKWEKVFGSCKRQMDLTLSLDMDSHRIDHVNFSML